MPIDYKKYPPNWKTEILPAIAKRSGMECEFCGIKNGQSIYSVKFWMKNEKGRYVLRSIWFSSFGDAIREASGKPIRKIRVVLTVAHLDHDETNHDVSLERLKHLCQCCHLRYDANEKYRRLLTKRKNKS